MLMNTSSGLRQKGPSRARSALAVLPSTPDTCGQGLLTTRPLIFFPTFPQLLSSNFSSQNPLQSHCGLPRNDILLANLYEDISIFPLGNLNVSLFYSDI